MALGIRGSLAYANAKTLGITDNPKAASVFSISREAISPIIACAGAYSAAHLGLLVSGLENVTGNDSAKLAASVQPLRWELRQHSLKLHSFTPLPLLWVLSPEDILPINLPLLARNYPSKQVIQLTALQIAELAALALHVRASFS